MQPILFLIFSLLNWNALLPMNPVLLQEKFKMLNDTKRELLKDSNYVQILLWDAQRNGQNEASEEYKKLLNTTLLKVGSIQHEITNLRQYFFNGIPVIPVSLRKKTSGRRLEKRHLPY